MKKKHSPPPLTRQKIFHLGISLALAVSLAVILLLLPVTAGTVRLPISAHSLLSNRQPGPTLNLPLPFGAAPVRATNGLTITKTAPEFVEPGGIITYTVIITNETGEPIINAIVTDPLPPNTSCGPTYIRPNPLLYPQWAYNCVPYTASWFMFYIPGFFPISFTNGTSNTLIFTVVVDEDVSNGTEIINDNYTTTANNGTFDDTGDPVTTTVRAPVWAITKTVSSATIEPGQYLTYTITITNNGSTATSGPYTVTDVLPANTVSGSVQIEPQPPGTLLGDTVTWVFTDSLADGSARVLTYSVQVASPLADGETIVNQTYRVSGGNVYTAAVGLPVTVTVQSPATLTIAKSAQPDPVQAGGWLTYTITVTNDASSKGPAAEVVISDTLAGEVIYQSAGFVGSTTGVVTDSGNPILWQLDDPIPVGGSAQVTVTGRVTSPLLPGLITNTFAASARNAPLVSDTLGSGVTSTNSITLSKNVYPPVVAPGDPVTYTIILTNSGNGIATLALTDILYADFNPSTYTQTALTLPGRTLSTAESVTTTTFTATTPMTPGIYYNQLVTATYDVTQATLSQIASVHVVRAAITITKVANVSTAGIGETITYTYRLTNTGDITLTELMLIDEPLGSVTLLTTTLGLSASTSGVATTLITEADLPGPIVNTATVTGTYLASNLVSTTTTESVSITYTTDITVDKIATPAAGSPAQVGDTITYTYYITNTGTVTLYTVTLNDDKLGTTAIIPPASPLGPGQGITVTDTTVVVESDLRGPLTNTVTVTGTNILSEITTPATDTASVPLTYTTGITVEKIATPAAGSPAQVGDTITYTYYITNTGSVTLYTITLNDDKLGTTTVITPPAAPLGPGESSLVTGTTVVTEGNLPGPLTNTVTVTGTNILSEIALATDTANVPLTYTTTISVEKTYLTSAGEPASIGDTITYTYRITNTGTVTLYTITLNDDKLGMSTIPTTPLGPGQSTTFTDTTVVVENDLAYPWLTNTVTVTGTNTLSEITAPATDTVSVALTYTLGITVNKTANPSTASPGDTITYAYRITNTGDITLTVILYDDELDTYPPLSALTVAPQDSVTGTAVKLISADDLPGPVVNTAIVTGTNNIVSNTVVATNTASVDLTYTTAISLEKIALPTQASINQVITYTYRITNSGEAPLVLTLFDDKLGLLATPVVTLAPGLSTEVITTHTVSAQDLINNYPLLTNTATVSGTYLTTTVNQTDFATVTLVYTPSIQLAKTANTTVATPGDVITYTYSMTNTGPLTLTILALEDDPLGSLISALGTTTLAPYNGQTTGSITYPVQPGDPPAITNTAVVTGQDVLGRVVTASKTLVVEVEEILTTIAAINDSPTVVSNTTFFTVTTNITNGVTYLWNFADGSSPGSGANPNHIYTTVGTYTVVVAAYNNVSLVTATTVVTITPGPTVRFNLQANSPQTAGNPFTVTITAVDAYNNPTGFTGLVNISDDTGTITPISVNILGGTATVYFTVTQATSPLFDTITAIDDGTGAISDTVEVEIRPNTPKTLTVTASPNPIHICETALVTTTLTDQWNNPNPNEQINLSVLSGSPPGSATIWPGSGNTSVNGIVTSILTGTASGYVRILGEWNTDPLVSNFPGHFVQIITPAVPSAITVTVDPPSVAFTEVATVTAEVRDCLGNAVTGTVVTFTVGSLASIVPPGTATTDINGLATITVTAGSAEGTTLITGTIVGPRTDNTLFTIQPPDTPALTLTKTAIPLPGVPVQPGATINYQIVVTNTGTASATNVVITDTLEALTMGYVTGTVTTGSGPFVNGNIITFAVPSLAINTAVTATVQITVTATSSGTLITNRANADSNQTVPTLESLVTHRVITGTASPGTLYLPIIMKNYPAPPDLTVQDVIVSNLTPSTGEAVTITVTLHNTGSAFATPFWVDLYWSTSSTLNPAVNQPWDEAFADATVPYGVAWKVYGMPADGVITITNLAPNDPLNNNNNYSNFIPNGIGNWPQTWKCMDLNNYFGEPRTYYLYVRVDSIDDNYPTSQDPNAEVVEVYENNNLFIFSTPVVVSGPQILPNPFYPPPCSLSTQGAAHPGDSGRRPSVQP
ncbi:MAG: DUF11 domain-containing protein [Anaerolineae bacterium]|nr:DUF11 domain-containing protein [Anaerolineae bacterium]